MSRSADPRFTARLRDLRQQRGMSLRDLARAAYSSKSHLHEFETGAATPSARTAQRIDDALAAGGELVRLIAPTVDAPVFPRREFVAGAAGLAVSLPTPAGRPRRIGSSG